MGHIRPFVEEDLAPVAQLHQKVFHTSSSGRAETYDAYFRRVFVDGPSRDEALPSLVYEERDGRIAGFLGVVPRRMSLNGQPVLAAVSSQFVVEPHQHTALVAVQLARTFLNGPQDLSISDEANDLSRKLWEGLGGTTALLHSLSWTRALRPAQFALSFLRERRGFGPIVALATPPARLVDAVVTGCRSSQFFQAAPASSGDSEACEALRIGLRDIAPAGALHPEYDESTFLWLIQRASQRKAGGRLHAAVLGHGDAAGCYLYCLDSTRIVEVLHIAATPSSIHHVLRHLFQHAWAQGATAATGRVEPRFLQAFSDEYSVFHRRGPWMLVKSRRPEIVRAFQSGDASFSRLDGEWCLGFQGSGP
jgi:hypothetical protein